MKGIEEITKKLEAGVSELCQSENYIRYLDCMAKFHDYCINNTILIYMQKPNASKVAGYKTWQNDFHRYVKKGEKAIQIIAPIPHKSITKWKNEKGEEKEREVTWMTYRAVPVFDISQTEGEELPDILRRLDGDVENYQEILDKIIASSPVEVTFEDLSYAYGLYSHAENRIAIKNGLPEQQTIKTLVHEIGHALLHNKNDGDEKDADKNTREVQAESVSYIVCNYLGLDTSDYSFGYIAEWSAGKDTKELTDSIESIKKAANTILDAIR